MQSVIIQFRKLIENDCDNETSHIKDHTHRMKMMCMDRTPAGTFENENIRIQMAIILKLQVTFPRCVVDEDVQ